MNLEIITAPVFRPLLNPARYKAAWGGRGSGKSHFFAELLVGRTSRPVRIVCIREVQNSIRDSVRQLIIDKIQQFGLGSAYDITENEIRGHNGALVIFKGMQSYNAENIKSLEGYDYAWVEEAQTFSERSLTMLRPTLRNDNSEIWFSWNPRFENDPVDEFFRKSARADSIVVEANWHDNKWFPDVLRKEKDSDYADDPDKADHVWGGAYNTLMEGSYYSRLILAAEKDNRIGAFPHNPSFPVWTAWDLGTADDTSIVFAQRINGWVHVIDHYYNRQEAASHYVDVLRRKPYTYAGHILPHDADRVDGWVNNLDRLGSLKQMGLTDIKVLDRIAEAEGINAARILLPTCRFNIATCDSLLKSLRHYHAEYHEERRVFMQKGLHDWSSHDAAAFRYLAMGLEPDAVIPPDIPRYSNRRRDRQRGTLESGWAA